MKQNDPHSYLSLSLSPKFLAGALILILNWPNQRQEQVRKKLWQVTCLTLRYQLLRDIADVIMSNKLYLLLLNDAALESLLGSEHFQDPLPKLSMIKAVTDESCVGQS